MKRNAIIALAGCLLLVLMLAGCGSEREYLEDICVPVEGRQAEIVIREWTFLLGSGSEIYFRQNGKEVMLGQLQGGDDAFCPFQAGQYRVTFDDSTVTIEWCIYPNATGAQEENWEKKVFEFPPESDFQGPDPVVSWLVVGGCVVTVGTVIAVLLLRRKKKA